MIRIRITTSKGRLVSNVHEKYLQRAQGIDL